MSTPVLLGFDGSDGAAAAIARAGAVLGRRPALVLTVWEPFDTWIPYDPATALDAGIAKLTPAQHELDEIATDMARKTVDRGVELARGAGFDATARIERGKTWETICRVASELDAELIVVGARGLSPVKSALLGSVSARVLAHAGRPVLVVPDQSSG